LYFRRYELAEHRTGLLASVHSKILSKFVLNSSLERQTNVWLYTSLYNPNPKGGGDELTLFWLYSATVI